MAIGKDRRSSFSHRYSLDDVRYEKNAPKVRHAQKKEPAGERHEKAPAQHARHAAPEHRRPEPRRVNSGSMRSIADRASSKGRHQASQPHGSQPHAPQHSGHPTARRAPKPQGQQKPAAHGVAHPRRPEVRAEVPREQRGAQHAPKHAAPHASQQSLRVRPAQAGRGPMTLPGSHAHGPGLPKKPGKHALSGPAPIHERGESNAAAFVDFFRRHLAVMVPVMLVIVAFLGFGLFDTASSWGKIHPGVTVQGVDVGGLTVDDAATKIESSLQPAIDNMRLIAYDSADTARADGKEVDDSTNAGVAYAATSSGLDLDGDGQKDKWRINKSTLGAYVDGHALAERAYQVGRDGNFIAERIGAWTSGTAFYANLSYNQELFNQLVHQINSALGTKVKNSRAKISDGTATLSAGHDGVEVDEDSFVRKLSAAVFNQSNPYCTIPMHQVTRPIGDDTAQRVVDQINSALSQDVTISYESSSWTLSGGELGSFVAQKVLKDGEVLTFGNSTQKVETTDSGATSAYDVSYGKDASSGSTLQPYVDQEKMDRYLVKILGKKATGGAQNARFKTDYDKGTVTIVPSKDGTGPDRASAEVAMQGILFGSQSGNRSITISTTTVQPELTTEQAQAMGIREKLASWSVPLSEGDSASRIKNIRLLCKLIDGSITAPGQTWSFNQTTGERTKEKGFETAPTIVNGRHEDELGGGICQVATCVFNCACYSGLGIGTRANHAFYIPAYDDRGFADATVSWETPDLQWVNDTQNSIMITAQAAAGGYVTVTFWGTDEGRQVTCDRGKWKKGDKYKTIKEEDPDLPAGETKLEQSGVDGRSITIHYIAKDKDGNTLHDIEFNSDYEAQNEIIGIGSKGSDSDGDSDADSGDDGDSSSESSDASSEDSSSDSSD